MHTQQEDAGSTGRGLHKEQREVTAWGECRTWGATSLVHGQSCCVQTPFTAVCVPHFSLFKSLQLQPLNLPSVFYVKNLFLFEQPN